MESLTLRFANFIGDCLNGKHFPYGVYSWLPRIASSETGQLNILRSGCRIRWLRSYSASHTCSSYRWNYKHEALSVLDLPVLNLAIIAYYIGCYGRSLKCFLV